LREAADLEIAASGVQLPRMPLTSAATRYWLVKSEPSVFSFDDLLAMPNRTTHWDGVRNYQARNTMRDGMKKGDKVFFYHSSTDPAEIVGVAEVTREGYPDPTALDPKDSHFDPKSKADAPTWFMVDIRAVEKLKRPLSLAELRTMKGLEKMTLLQKGSRLSVQPVSEQEWKIIYAAGMKEL
jgi:predicted RNA-binding protein with PUA-like domain